jgi:hypothetical protein
MLSQLEWPTVITKAASTIQVVTVAYPDIFRGGNFVKEIFVFFNGNFVSLIGPRQGQDRG